MCNTEYSYKKNNGFAVRLSRVLGMLVFAFMLCISADGMQVRAAGSVDVISVDYDRSEMTIQLGEADSLLLISDAKQKKWELVPQEKDASGRIVLDISWVSLTKDYVISLKGDVSSEPVKITIPKQITNFKAVYSTALGTVSFTNDGTRKIQWKKKNSFNWEEVNKETLAEELYGLCANGATVCFRLAPVNGTGLSSPGTRPSKEINVTVPKKSAAPVIRINDSTQCIPVTKGMEYRYLDSDLNPKSGLWIPVEKTENLPVASIAAEAMAGAAVQEDVYIQFRTKSNSSRQISNTTSIRIPKQPLLTEDIISGITLTYTSSTTFEIKVLAAGTKTPYEYCIIKSEDIAGGISIEDTEELKWIEISSNSPVVIDKDADGVKDGSQVYVRRKALNEQGSEDYSLASPVYRLRDVSYPGEVSSYEGGLVWYQTVAGVCNQENTEGHISFKMYSPTKNAIKTLKFVDYDNKNVYGNVDISSTVADNPLYETEQNEDRRYIITTTIKSTAAIDSFTKKKMLAYITFDGKAEFESDSTKGIGLYIYPASRVNNPATDAEKMRIGRLFDNNYELSNDKIPYSGKFTRVYNSGEERVNGYYPNFKFKLELGNLTVPDLNSQEVGRYTETAVSVTSIKYDGVTFNVGDRDSVSNKEYFTVDYVNDRSATGDEIRVAVVTVNADVIEKHNMVDLRDVDAPLLIYLNNGEVLGRSVTLKLANTAAIVNGPLSWSLTAGTLKTEETITKTEGDTTTTKTQKVVSYTIDLAIFDKAYDVAILDVLWGTRSIYDTAAISGGKAHIELSNAKINSITVDGSTTEQLEIIFSNGYSIKSGCTMTILAGVQTDGAE